MANSSQAARVEVLTAEVRTLVVGSRQVTLSVARQLDEVTADFITPFGRIDTGRKLKPTEWTALEVIGRHNVSGSLVMSVATSRPMICGSNVGDGQVVKFLGYPDSGRQVKAISGICATHYKQPGRRAAGESHVWVEFYPAEETYSEWLDLPLIVLAGLR